jgi:hypothetical protein
VPGTKTLELEKPSTGTSVPEIPPSKPTLLEKGYSAPIPPSSGPATGPLSSEHARRLKIAGIAIIGSLINFIEHSIFFNINSIQKSKVFFHVKTVERKNNKPKQKETFSANE